MKTRIKTVLSFVLAVVLLVPSIPMSVFASDTTTNGSVAEVVNTDEVVTETSSNGLKYTIEDVIAGAITIDEYEAYLEELYAVEEETEETEIVIPELRSLFVSKSSDVTFAVGRENIYKQGHIKREYAKEKEDLNKVIYKNADGTYTQYLFNYPVKYVNENGNISDVSLKVEAAEKGGFKTKKVIHRCISPKI